MHPIHRAAVTSAVCLVASLALSTTAQAQGPRSIVTVAVAANGTTSPLLGEMYWIDHEKNTRTKIATPKVFNTDRPNCVLMMNPIAGFVGTNPTATTATGNIFSFTVVNNKLTLGNSGKPLNTSATAGGNISQIVLVGSGTTARLYFVSQTAGAVGTLQSIPLAGGKVTADYNLTSLPSTLLANALTTFAGKIYIGTWSLSSTAAGELIEYNVSTKKAKKIMDLPFSKYKGAAGTSKFGLGCVNMQIMLPRLSIGILGIYGDKVEVHPLTGKLISHTFHGPLTSPTTANSINSGYYDPTSNDWVIGTRRGSIERWVGDGAAVGMVTLVGSHPTTTGNSVNGVYHFPVTKNSDISYGSGCPLKKTGLTPTDAPSGAIVSGNKNFALALWNAPPKQMFILAIAAAKLNVNFGNPGCKLLVNPLLMISGMTSAAGNVLIPIALAPNLPKTAVAYRQWGCADGAGGFVLSNARMTTIN